MVTLAIIAIDFVDFAVKNPLSVLLSIIILFSAFLFTRWVLCETINNIKYRETKKKRHARLRYELSQYTARKARV
jgi:fumarate reductase subunit C